MLRLRDVAKLVGDETLRGMVQLAEPCPEDEKMRDCIEEEATKLAVSAAKAYLVATTVKNLRFLVGLNFVFLTAMLNFEPHWFAKLRAFWFLDQAKTIRNSSSNIRMNSLCSKQQVRM